jgi:MFS family permease
MFTAVTLWLLIFCLVAGGLSLLRYNRERHCRLFAQLPVTNLQIRLSFWCHACLYVLVSTCVLVLIMFYADIEPLTGILRFAALYFFHAGVLLSTITIASSSSMRLIPEEVRSRTILYFFLAVALTFMFLFAIGFVVAGYLHVVESDSVNWSMLTLLMLLLCAALVSLDIHLFRGKDTYLG